MIHTDVLIVGGGPAGAACAWALRRQGLDVLVLERETFPRSKLCAGWISPEVLEDLEIDAEDYPYALTTVKRLSLSVRGLRLRLSTRQLSIRRIEFDDWLLRRSGARVIHHPARDITQQENRYTVDDAFSGRFLVGAGGTHCPVARTYFADANPLDPQTLVVTQEEEFRYPYRHDGRGDACHLWFLEKGFPGYAWYSPKAEGFVNAGIGGRAEALKARGESIQDHWERLVITLDELDLVRDHTFKPRGHAYYLREGKRQLRVGNAFVIGDAAGLATRDMGEGIAPAVRSGLLAAESIVTGRPINVSRIRRWSQPQLIGWLLAHSYG